MLHPGLAHSPRTVADLLETLKDPRGLTLIRGGTEASRSYLLAALGHTYSQLFPRRPQAGGLDIVPPDKFVPVETLHYLGTTGPDGLRQIIREVWPRIEDTPSQLILLHGIWSLAPDLRNEILACSKHRHVVLADTVLPDLNQIATHGINPLRQFTLAVADQRIEVSRRVWKPRGRPQKKCR